MHTTKKSFFRIVAALSVTVVAGALSGCEGRTDKNMVPNGDTVEVVITPLHAPDTQLDLDSEVIIGDSISPA